MLILIAQFQDRMWRKTVTKGTVCNGVDPNRNWDDHWNGNVEYSTFCFIKTFQRTKNPYTLMVKAFQCCYNTRVLRPIHFRLLLTTRGPR